MDGSWWHYVKRKKSDRETQKRFKKWTHRYRKLQEVAMGLKSVDMVCGVYFGGERRAGKLTSLVSRQIPPPWILNLDFFSGYWGTMDFMEKINICIHCRFQRVSLLVLHSLCWREENLGQEHERSSSPGLGRWGDGVVDGKLGRRA